MNGDAQLGVAGGIPDQEAVEAAANGDVDMEVEGTAEADIHVQGMRLPTVLLAGSIGRCKPLQSPLGHRHSTADHVKAQCLCYSTAEHDVAHCSTVHIAQRCTL